MHAPSVQASTVLLCAPFGNASSLRKAEKACVQQTNSSPQDPNLTPSHSQRSGSGSEVAIASAPPERRCLVVSTLVLSEHLTQKKSVHHDFIYLYNGGVAIF